MIWKEIRDDQLFVYFNGVCIYKKWFKNKYRDRKNSIVFDLYWHYWRADRDRGDFMAHKETPPDVP